MNTKTSASRAIHTLMRRGLAAIVILGAASAALAQANPKPLTIGVIELFPNPHFAEARKGMKEVARKNNATLLIQNANVDTTKEAQFVQTFITRKVDAILLSAVSPTGSLAALRLARSAGIPVVCYTTCVNAPDDQELVRAFVKSDNLELGATTGKQAAAYIQARLGGKARVLMLTCESYDVCKERRKGLNQNLAGSDIQILAEQEGFLADKARPIADSMLAAHPDANVFIAENEDAVIAAAQAIKAKGLAGKVAVFGIDINTQVAQLIAAPDGIVHWTTGQDPRSLGARGLEAAVQAARGQPVGDFYQVAGSPSFSKDNPAAAQKYAADRR
ncbi:monosaccharide ABC transporter substrate-binding protein, CUT2 family [Variovorax sp. CF079]|uniref:substrate-binding domain-containing protein n=1 Tax=Variovorax sp. CF079 TaxID=1882774 RepID=UPI0008815C55|nr:substrate-binding domain-containing protein [Variovorax sp. CF079]SDE92015.1 monosaccharide ABC transporter substrate-binding protein, CUT2 family [Variovorax sp. CF079]